MVGAPPVNGSVGAPPVAPPSPPPQAPPAAPPQITCPNCTGPNPAGSAVCQWCGSNLGAGPAPSAPAGESVEDLQRKEKQLKREVVGSTIMAVATEGATAGETVGKAAQLKQTEEALKEAKKRESEAESRKNSAESKLATASTGPLTPKKLFAQPAMVFVISLVLFLYLRYIKMNSIANWILISGLISIIIGIIFKEPKKGLLFLLVPLLIGFLNMMNLVTPANSIIVVGFVSMLILLTFEKTREFVNKVLNVGVYVAGGVLIFWLSAWAQVQIGVSYPHIVTTTLMIAYFSFVLFKKEKPAIKFSAIVVNILFFFVIFTMPTIIAPQDSAFYNSVESQRAAWVDMLSGVGLMGKEIYKGAQMQYYTAIGDYESGVEAEQQKPLGVFLDNIGISSKMVQVTDSINAFGTLRVESFKTAQPVDVSVRCYVKDRENVEGSISPTAKFSVEQYESQDIDCIFPEAGDVGVGPQVIDFEASFSFTTSAYLKSYFMEQSRIRDLRRQEKDPLDAFGITDKNPVAVFTGGPLMIGLGAGQQPVALLDKSQPGFGSGPTLGITFDKNWLEGELLNVTRLNISVPSGLTVNDVDGRKICPDKSQNCVLEGDALKRLFGKPIVLPKTIRVHTGISDPALVLSNAPMAIQSFKVGVEYVYVIRKGVEVIVTGVSS